MIKNMLQTAGWLLDQLADDVWREKTARLKIPTNESGVDAWGMSPAFFRSFMALANWLYVHYFRVQASGLENIPSGRALLIGNHSGQIAWDGLMVLVATVREGEPPRIPRSMAEKFLIRQPWLGTMTVRLGQVTGLPENGRRLLEEDNLVMVFPEGARGVAKPWFHRYELQKFGTGFMRMALETQTPIIPFAFVGGEEIMINLGNIQPLAKLLNFPSFPMLLTPLPLPSKCSLHFGAPMVFEGDGHEPDDEIQTMVDEVRATIDGMIQNGLAQRTSVFFG